MVDQRILDQEAFPQVGSFFYWQTAASFFCLYLPELFFGALPAEFRGVHAVILLRHKILLAFDAVGTMLDRLALVAVDPRFLDLFVAATAVGRP